MVKHKRKNHQGVQAKRLKKKRKQSGDKMLKTGEIKIYILLVNHFIRVSSLFYHCIIKFFQPNPPD